MTKFLINGVVETKGAHCLNFAFAVEAQNSTKAKSLIREFVARTMNGEITQFDLTTNIARMNLKRYHFHRWAYVNFTPEQLAAENNLPITW